MSTVPAAALRGNKTPSAATFVLEGEGAFFGTSSGTVWTYSPPGRKEQIDITVKEKIVVTEQTEVSRFPFCSLGLVAGYDLGKEAPATLGNQSAAIDIVIQPFVYLPKFLHSWVPPRASTTRMYRKAKSQVFGIGKGLLATLASGAATVNERLVSSEREFPRWSELALSTFSPMRGMTKAESAAYRAFKQRVFRRR